jgi:hypothetical protein
VYGGNQASQPLVSSPLAGHRDIFLRVFLLSSAQFWQGPAYTGCDVGHHDVYGHAANA